MKKFVIPIIVIASATCLILDAIRLKADRIYRYAAGESSFERTNPKKRKK